MRNILFVVCLFCSSIAVGQSCANVSLDGISINSLITPTDFPLRIGMGLTNMNEYFKGDVDDIRIYNRAMSECEVKDLYDKEKPPVRQVDVSGYWQGVLYQGSATPSFSYGMALTQNNVSVNGISTIQTTDITSFGKKVLIGNTNQGTLKFTENSILAQRVSGFFYWCLLDGNLVMDSTGNKLSGVWTSGSCTPGTIEIYRLKLFSDSCTSGLTTIRLLGQNIKWYSDSLNTTPIYW
jgi:hypothetical protein